MASEAQHPRFVRDFMGAYRWHGHDVPGARTGGDNPDNRYRLAGIAHGSRYRITARPIDREPAHASFNLVGNFGTTVILGSTESHLVTREPDGSFVITIDDQPAGGRPNHLTTQPHAKFLFVRDSMEDWTAETPFDLTIERLGAPSRDPLSLDEIADRAVVRTREDVSLYFWFQMGIANMWPNTVMPPSIGRGMGGMLTQGVTKGHFRLEEDEAVILEYDPAGARYASIELMDWFYRSLDAHRIQSSLSRSQSRVDSDGRIRVVIAHRDPGVANWIDTGGRTDTLLHLRWQGLAPGTLSERLHLQVDPVPFAQLRDRLPATVAWVDAGQRDAQIRARRDGYARRIRSSAA